MSDIHPARVRDVFMEAINLPQTERTVFIARACGDDKALLHEVQQLLRADAESGEFLGSPTIENIPKEVPSPPGELVGDLIGPYRLAELLGLGGYGTVYRATQEQPIRREVALKVIKLGMDTHSVIERFKAERDVLALMDHPNIARIFDAGATDTGRPYFVMELCRGQPIDEYCDQNKLDIRQRMALFVQACAAVNHAHTKGIIHRDIKPGNVLITLLDGSPCVKVIDFGIAKAIDSRRSQLLQFTQNGQMIGTPEYMSPEQAEGSPDIDTRTDVYSLGVLLYKLLAGDTPFGSEELRARAYVEIQRIIMEDDPPTPSTRLRESTATNGAVATQRRTEPHRLAEIVSGELDWIVMRAMEKHRLRRYQFAQHFADDIQRYLDGEAVVAAPPGWLYRGRKFVNRHLVPVVAAVAVLLALAFGLASTAWQAHRANLLAAKEATQRQIAVEAKGAAEREKDRLQHVLEFVTGAFRATDPEEGGKEGITVVDAMHSAMKQIEAGRFKDDPETEATVKDTIGLILQDNGHTADAVSLLQDALAARERIFRGDHPAVSLSLSNLAGAYMMLDRETEAEVLLKRSFDMDQRLYTEDDPNLANAINNYAMTLKGMGRPADAEPLLERSLLMKQKLYPPDHHEIAVALNNLGLVRLALGRGTEAESLFKQSLDMKRRLDGGDSTDVAIGLNSLGGVEDELGHPEEAAPLYRQAMEMFTRIHKQDHADIADSMSNLADALKGLGRLEEAEPLCRQALEMRKRLYGGDHSDVAISLNNLASLLSDRGQFADAQPLYQEALDMRRRIWKSADRVEIAQSLSNLATVVQKLGNTADAEPLYQEALDMRVRLIQGDHPVVALGLNNLAQCRMYLGKLELGEQNARAAVAMYQRLFPEGHPRLAVAQSTLALVLSRQDKGDEARDLVTQAYTMVVRMAPQEGPEAKYVLKAKKQILGE